ncbi:MAG: tRNA (adenosine(37)-N6)-dimethylallyltransferase MiaA [Gemmatimonadales bacterium]|nr:MAG: tRNA (adenosine(37)-N6)-dimethylallyltransferase MiaA [Gemmatimonadales bacterium]
MKSVPAILGPTATGKTHLAIAVAERIGGEVISADSRQAYRGLAVGTAAPTGAELARVPHHGVGFLAPGERYGAGRFARLARIWIEEIRDRDRIPILAGGTGLFYRALTRPIFREPTIETTRKGNLEAWLESHSLEALRRWSSALDPELSERLVVLDRQRCLRAIEIALLTGRRLTWWQNHGPPEAKAIRVTAVVLTLSADEHRARIRSRAEKLLDRGWAEEIELLRAAGHGLDSPAFSSIGYRTVAEWIRGETSRDEALTSIVRDTWAYARRLRTWFRHQLPPDAPTIDAGMAVDRAAEVVIEAWRQDERQETTAE